MLKRYLPFLSWFPMSANSVRADLLAGIAVALVLIPQSMAYAQLAGLPAVYGLYASFLPVMIASLWGSSSQLATGPAAVLSLLTASALIPLASPGSTEYVALAILLALMVGLVQILLGVTKMGTLVNFISHPVIVGFTNAAALIIGLSQLNKLFGLPLDRDHAFLVNIWNMLLQIGNTHLPTLAMGVGSIALMWGLKRKFPRFPGTLTAVAIAVLISWLIQFEQKQDIPIEAIADQKIRELVINIQKADKEADDIENRIRQKEHQLTKLESLEAITLRYEIERARLESQRFKENASLLQQKLRDVALYRADENSNQYYLEESLPATISTKGNKWHISRIKENQVTLDGGGAVVGTIPEGLPSLAMPTFDPNTFISLLATAFIISMVGFTEAIAIAKAMAAKTGERINPNQELIGQGLANVVGSFSQGYPVSGSFSRSAVNLTSGAKTGLSSVISGLVVLMTLLFLTPALYHLPQAVLAAIIMMAVAGLINFKSIRHAWDVNRHDGIAAMVTFVTTLIVAPNLDHGIMTGIGLSLILFLYRTMKPRISELGRHPDGTLRDAKLYGLDTKEKICLMRFDGRLYFANVPYFEDAVLNLVASHPDVRYVVIVCKGINEMDASGEDVVRHLTQRLRERNIVLVFAGIKAQILDVMNRAGLLDMIGEKYIFKSTEASLQAIQQWLKEESIEAASNQRLVTA